MIKLKGMHDSIIRCIIPEDAAPSDIVEGLQGIVSKGKAMLPGCRVVLDFGARSIAGELIASVMSDFIMPTGIEVLAWITADEESRDVLKRIGLPSEEPSQRQRTSRAPKRASAPGAAQPAGQQAKGLVLYKPLRSGQRIDHSGDVMIAGHVNSGAEIFASGNVIVLGRLCGLVHAGCDGDDSASIAARALEAPQLRIGTKVGSLDREAQWWGMPIIARIDRDTVLIDYWPAVRSKKDGQHRKI